MASSLLRIVLTGFSGTGKSRVASLIAQRLGWQIIDTDSLVVAAAGRPILHILRQDGEERFRDLESEALRQAFAARRVVISSGGGGILRPDNRRLSAEGGFVVCLEARPETILRRLRNRSEREPLDRPLLAVADPLARIRDLKAGRQHLYALADWTVHTDGISPDGIAAEVIRAWRNLASSSRANPHRVAEMTAVEAPSPSATLHSLPDDAACTVHSRSAAYPVYVGWHTLTDLGQRMREANLTRQAYLISDETVFAHYGSQAEAALARANIPVASYTVPPGEASKSLETVATIYDWLVDHRAERGHSIVALGGGMITDLAGYVAATFARGLPLVQAPTSLLAMVDAAISGNAAVNHPQAQNIIGSFCQPRLVLVDVATLRTLSPHRRATGWAEVTEHAFIAHPDLLTYLKENAERILELEPEPTTEAIRRSVAIKATVIAEDRR